MVLWLCSNEHTVVSDPALGQPICRTVKKSQTPASTVRAPWGGGQGAWLVYAGRCGCARWVQRLGAVLAVVAVDTEALIWELVWMDFLTLRGDPGLYEHAAQEDTFRQ